MATKKVRAGSKYTFDPCLWDIADRRPYMPAKGTVVRVMKSPHGCPPANAMGHCYIETLAGEFLGLVSTGSLQPVGA